VRGVVDDAPVEHAGSKGRCGIRIGDQRQRGGVGETGKKGKLVPPSGAYGVREVGTKVAEVQEGLLGGELLAHEQQGDWRRQQHYRGQCFQHRGMDKVTQTLAKSPVANLVVGLQKIDESGRRQMTAHFAAWLAVTERRRFALIGKALTQAAAQQARRIARVVGVMAVDFAAGQNVQDVVLR